jgi:rubredoxin
MEIPIEKIPGGFNVDGMALKNGKCGCTTVLPCCYSWSKVKRTGNSFLFTAKLSGPDSHDVFTWSYIVTKGDSTIEVRVEDARDKTIFSGYYPPTIEAWVEKGWEVLKKDHSREDYGVWRCSACKWLYKEHEQKVEFPDIPTEWKCPVCRSGKEVFESVG